MLYKDSCIIRSEKNILIIRSDFQSDAGSSTSLNSLSF